MKLGLLGEFCAPGGTGAGLGGAGAGIDGAGYAGISNGDSFSMLEEREKHDE